jgi:outer membrane protein OmpA-like peptidoglycan-associated protein
MDIERFKPIIDSQGFVLTEGGKGEMAGDINVGFYSHYSRNPLVLSLDGEITNHLVSDRISGNFFVSMGIANWLSVGVDVPAVFYQQGEILGQSDSLSSLALGDIRVIPKFTIFREENHGISLALSVPVSLPSGDETAYNGSKSLTVSPTLAASRKLLGDLMFLGVNIGAWLQQPNDYMNLSTDHELFYRVGAGIQYADGCWALGELAAAGGIKNLFKNKPHETPMEWIVSLRFMLPADLNLTIGGAFGTLEGYGTPNFRGFLGLLWAPRTSDKDGDGLPDGDDRCAFDPGPRENDGCPWQDSDGDSLLDNVDDCPDQAGPPDNKGCPVGDRDNDGLADNRDKCPSKAGPQDNQGCPHKDADSDGIFDKDDKCPDQAGPQDNQGCPWGDKDADGIPDNVDKCIEEAEDIDGFQDDDGCLDFDNDKDGVADKEDKCPDTAGPAANKGCPIGDLDGDGVKDNRDKCPEEAGPKENKGCPWGDSDNDGLTDDVDKCPKKAEDKDEFEDQDGCPDPDNDKDGVLDADDKCPTEPETINGYQDEDGCPDKGKILVIVKKKKIEILQKVHFASGRAKIMPDSFSLLNQIAQILKAHSEIKKIRIEGHTDSVGPNRKNKRLSQRRANAVRKYIIKKGIDPKRLKAVGFGEAKPIATNKTPKGRETNRRVEFKILERE